MHLIPLNRHSGRKLDARDLAEAFGADQNGLDVEQPEPRYSPLTPLDAEGVRDASAQHLVAAAEAEDLPAVAVMGEQVDVPTLASQEFEIADRRLRTGKDHQHDIARQRLPGWHKDQLYPRLGSQRVEIIEIGDAGQQWDSDPDRPPALTRRAALGARSRSEGDGQRQRQRI